MQTQERTIPNVFLSALINSDYSGLSDGDHLALDNFIENELRQYEQFHALCDIEDIGFTKYHDLKSFGIMACDCSQVSFAV